MGQTLARFSLILFLLFSSFGLSAVLLASPSWACENIVCDSKTEDEGEYLKCIDQKRTCLETKLTEVQGERITLTNTISIINGKISIQELQINQLIAEISLLEREVGSLSERIDGLNVSLDRLSTVLINRIRAQYKHSSQATALSMLASAESLNQFFNQYKYLSQAGQQTALAMSRAETQRMQYDEQKALKELKQEQVLGKQIAVESEKQVLAQQRQEQQHLLRETQNSEAKYQAELAKTLAELQAIQSIIAGKGTESEVGEVEQGDRIASIIVGASTCSTGTHLHFEVVRKGINYNPAQYLKSVSSYVWNNSPDGSFSFTGEWDWPVDDPARINQGYGMTYYARVRRAYGGAPHTGIDMMSKSALHSVRAVQEGTLFRGSIQCGGGLLRYVRVKHKDSDINTYYLHVNYL
jgi:peptidoglycan hydrolase CwlO-like protein